MADGVDVELLVADEHGAVHPAGHLVAGRTRVGVRGCSYGLPLQVQPEGHPVAAQIAVDLAWLVDPYREGLAAERHVVEGRLHGVVGPEAFGPDLQ